LRLVRLAAALAGLGRGDEPPRRPAASLGLAGADPSLHAHPLRPRAIAVVESGPRRAVALPGRGGGARGRAGRALHLAAAPPAPPLAAGPARGLPPSTAPPSSGSSATANPRRAGLGSSGTSTACWRSR